MSLVPCLPPPSRTPPPPQCAQTIPSGAETPTRPQAQGPWAPRNGRCPPLRTQCPPRKDVSGAFTGRPWASGQETLVFLCFLFV